MGAEVILGEGDGKRGVRGKVEGGVTFAPVSGLRVVSSIPYRMYGVMSGRNSLDHRNVYRRIGACSVDFLVVAFCHCCCFSVLSLREPSSTPICSSEKSCGMMNLWVSRGNQCVLPCRLPSRHARTHFLSTKRSTHLHAGFKLVDATPAEPHA